MIQPNTKTIQNVLSQAFNTSNLPLPLLQRGKVRDSYQLSEQQSTPAQRLIITTDRLSAFDRVLHALPYKGQVLNQLAAWWFSKTADIIPNHLISLPDPNALIAVDVEPLPLEVIVRGYITGVTQTALWYRYSLGERDIYGYHFPEGLHKNQQLPQPIITPTTKGTAGKHDERLTCAEVVSLGLLDADTWDYIQQVAIALFQRGQQLAAQAGLLLVDTKYEFGRDRDGRILLIDEVHTPDSSRFWLTDSYAARFAAEQEPENFDKEWIRLAYKAAGYTGEGAPPQLPDDVWAQLCQRYIESYERLTSQAFVPASYPVEARLLGNLKGYMT